VPVPRDADQVRFGRGNGQRYAQVHVIIFAALDH
jgi:hypothetical protein